MIINQAIKDTIAEHFNGDGLPWDGGYYLLLRRRQRPYAAIYLLDDHNPTTIQIYPRDNKLPIIEGVPWFAYETFEEENGKLIWSTYYQIDLTNPESIPQLITLIKHINKNSWKTSTQPSGNTSPTTSPTIT